MHQNVVHSDHHISAELRCESVTTQPSPQEEGWVVTTHDSATVVAESWVVSPPTQYRLYGRLLLNQSLDNTKHNKTKNDKNIKKQRKKTTNIYNIQTKANETKAWCRDRSWYSRRKCTRRILQLLRMDGAVFYVPANTV